MFVFRRGADVVDMKMMRCVRIIRLHRRLALSLRLVSSFFDFSISKSVWVGIWLTDSD